MTRTLTASALAAAIGGALLLTAPASLAGETTQPQLAQSQQSQPAQPANFSEEELRSFVTAATEVQQLSMQWQQRLKASKDDKQKSQQIRQKATQEITQAVRDEGLTVKEYNQISMAARQDEALRKKLKGYLNEQN